MQHNVQDRPDVRAATAAVLELYGNLEHPWEPFIQNRYVLVEAVQPFALGLDWRRLRHALALVSFFGARILNALALGYWV